MVDLLERLDIMFQQEQTAYKTEDYLDPDLQKKLASVCEPDFLESNITFQSSECFSRLSTAVPSGINDIWREKICEWSYQVIDHFDYSREVLAAMTSLFLAIKLFEPGRLSMSSMVELSRGYFNVDQMMKMEMSILRSLSWHVHPPTAYSFSKHILFLLPHKSVSLDVRHHVLELARFLTELSVIDYFFVIHRPSVVAFAALINAMEDIVEARSVIPQFAAEVKKVCHLHVRDENVAECRTRLRLLYSQGSFSKPTAVISGARDDSTSPVCVSYGCHPHDLTYELGY